MIQQTDNNRLASPAAATVVIGDTVTQNNNSEQQQPVSNNNITFATPPNKKPAKKKAKKKKKDEVSIFIHSFCYIMRKVSTTVLCLGLNFMFRFVKNITCSRNIPVTNVLHSWNSSKQWNMFKPFQSAKKVEQ